MPYVQYLVPFLDDTGVASRALVVGHEKTLQSPGEPLLNQLSQLQYPLGNDISIPQSTRESFCAACKSIDFDRITSLEFEQTEDSDYRFRQQNIITKLNDLSQPTEILTCPLCRFFQSVLACSASVEPALFQLQAASTRHVFVGMSGEGLEDVKGIEGSEHSVLLNVRMEATKRKSEHAHETVITACPVYVYSQAQENPLFHVRVLDAEVDVNFARSCLDYCGREHGDVCNSTPVPFLNFNVIDCNSRQIVKAEKDCQYVALSYVWGKSSAVAQPSNCILQNVPTVIEDSITVTLKLGFQYLWVDQYCIDQHNDRQRHTQIQQMDRIYANAQCTIISAVGDGPEHGLPGVRNSRRLQKPVLKLGKWTLISTVPDLPSAVGKSTWRSRGWTYQEFLLSKRRLVFGEYQTYFICNMMQCAESLVLPQGQIQVDNDREDSAGISNGSFGYALPGKHPHNIMEYISQFSDRKLSYPKDTLDAIEAIFEAFRLGQRPVYNFWGIPIAHPDILSDKNPQETEELAHCDSVHEKGSNARYKPSGRNAKEGFLIGMTWRRGKPAKRRKLFPSWSWAGWDGPVLHNSGIVDVMSSSERLNNVDLYVELDDEKTVEFPDFADLPSFLEQYSDHSKYIHIVAPFLEVRGLECVSPEFFKMTFDLGEEKGSIQLQISLDAIWENKTVVDLSGICFGTPTSSWNILVLQNMGTHYERCGIYSRKASAAQHDHLDFQTIIQDTPKRDIRLG